MRIAAAVWVVVLCSGCARAGGPHSIAAEPAQLSETQELHGEARVQAQAQLRQRSGRFLEYECIEDDECVTTNFHDCCRNNAGEADCTLTATRADQLQHRLLECGAEECTDGAASCPDDVEFSSARCVITKIGQLISGTCELR